MSGVKRALISVSDKSEVDRFGRALADLGYEIVSTGGTARALREAGVQVTDVTEITGFPEIMDGRVKTLHPLVHGGVLGRGDLDAATMDEHGIAPISVVCVNLYPFEETVAKPGCSPNDAIENIDIGGPAMIRAAAKNHRFVTVIVDPLDYDRVLKEMDAGEVSDKTRERLAQKAFGHTACYDAAIWAWFRSYREDESLPERMPLALQGASKLRYGENPHQRASVYRSTGDRQSGLADVQQHQGKELSYNNLADADAAVECVMSIEGPACVIVKHANPCGVGIGSTGSEAYQRAFVTDPESAFGGIIAFNEAVSEELARDVVERQFVEVIVAPGFQEGALAAFSGKPNVRVLELSQHSSTAALALTQIAGGMLVQDRDLGQAAESRVVTRRQPSEQELADARLAWTVCRHVKSNAIVFARDGGTVGIGAGQMSRVMSVRIAGWKAGEAGLETAGAAMASDAFFPFRDGLDQAAQQGISTVIQPGGSVRDEEVISAADEHGMAMIFTGMRHFRH